MSTDHMKQRRGHGLSVRELAAEFGVSKSTAHRRTTPMAKKMAGKAPAAPPPMKVGKKVDAKANAAGGGLKYPAGKVEPVKTDRGSFGFRKQRG